MRTLSLLLLLTLPARAEPATEGAVRLDGAPPTRNVKPPMSYFRRLNGGAVVLGREGFLIPQRSGYAASRWSEVAGLEMERTLVRLKLKDGDNVLVSLDESRPDLPCLADAGGFLAALGGALNLKLVRQERGGTKRYTVRLKANNSLPGQPLRLPATGLVPSGWPTRALAALSPQPGLVLNEHGIARVTPSAVESVRWEKAQEFTFYAGLPGVTDPSIAVLDRPKNDRSEYVGLVLRPDDRFFLPPAAFHQLATLLPTLQGKTHLHAPPKPVFLPLHTCDPTWAKRSDTPDSVPSQPLSHDAGLWPNQVSSAGLYILPAGLMHVRGYVVETFPWGTLRCLDGRPDGSMKLTPRQNEIFPSSPEEVPLFRQARRDILQAAHLQPTGKPSPMYQQHPGTPGTITPHFYPLSDRSAWTGLPLYTLGPTRWAPGLYLLHDGLVSVQENRIGLAPWTDVEKIGIADWGQGGRCLRAQLKEWGMRTFPAGAQDSEVTLSLDALNALAKYVDTKNFVPTLRSDRPTDPTYIPYFAPGEMGLTWSY